MTEHRYQTITAPFRRHPMLCQILRLSNWVTTLCVYGIYSLYLLRLLFHPSIEILPAIVVPGTTFVLLSWYRDRVNAPRPYEVLNIQPIIPKQTKGHSFPSRHVFSVFVIAVTIGFPLPKLGLFLVALGLLISVNRVIGGVHFPKDVIAGMAAGLLSGLLGCTLFQYIL